MSAAEIALLAGAAGLYALSFLAAWKGAPRAVLPAMAAGLVLHLAAAVVRWIGSGHPPVFGTYEAALSASWFLLVFAGLAFVSMHGHFRLLVLLAVPVALLLLGYGLTFDTQRMPLTISEVSLWIDAHALFAWLAFAPLTLAFCLSGFYLWNEARPGHGAAATPHPRLEIIDELAFRYVNLGFINYTVMFALGCYYSSILFGTWWQWDPVFSIALVGWLCVALYIHLRLFYQWNGARAARLFAVVFAVVAFAYWGLAYLPSGSTFHVFDIDVKAL